MSGTLSSGIEAEQHEQRTDGGLSGRPQVRLAQSKPGLGAIAATAELLGDKIRGSLRAVTVKRRTHRIEATRTDPVHPKVTASRFVSRAWSAASRSYAQLGSRPQSPSRLTIRPENPIGSLIETRRTATFGSVGWSCARPFTFARHLLPRSSSARSSRSAEVAPGGALLRLSCATPCHG